jgi:hypothetical protein
MKRLAPVLFLLLSVYFNSCKSHSTAPDAVTLAPRSKDMLAAVNTFIGSLKEEQSKKVLYAFEDEERYNWHFIPRDRKGLPFKEMTAEQRQLATALLKTTMSDQGYNKAKSIMELEVVLKALENLPPENDRRDPEKYYFTVFGKPSDTEPWGWRMEGHHISLNFSSASGQVSAETPAFMGTNPGIVLEGPAKGKQILKQEADLGFELLHSFTPEQLRKVMIAEIAPNEIVTSNSRKAMLDKSEGILYSEMTPAQQQIFMRLLNVYLDNYRQDLAQPLRTKVTKAGMDKTYFAWAGHNEPVVGKAHYYRIHNPVLLIEYDNSQNNANHVHTVIRDLSNDFGEDALRAHYQKHPHKN